MERRHNNWSNAAGLAANLAPALLRSYEEESRLVQEQQLYDKYMAMGMGPHHIGDDEQEVCTPAACLARGVLKLCILPRSKQGGLAETVGHVHVGLF